MNAVSSKTSLLVRGLGLALASAFAALTTGCTLQSSGTSLAGEVKISGTALGGRQPVIGATVNLYATGNAGYGSAATLIGTATTNSVGQFTITRNANSCTSPQQFYLVSSGGDPGSGANSAAVLVSALGPCASVTTGTTGLVINELTTVAAAYALQGFADATSNIGTSATNSLGLTHAFANASTLVANNGVANASTPGGNGTVPTAVINALGDVLASCVNSSGPTSTPCSNILLGAPAAVSAPTPANVWQEALNIARFPAYQTTALYNAIAASGAYPTSLAQPNDFSIGIAYSAGLENDGATAASFPWDIKADANDNIWVSGMTKAGLVELSNSGTLLSPNGGWGNATLQAAFTHDLAFDTTLAGNVWAADNAGNIWEYTPAGTPSAPTAGTTTQIAAASPKGPIGIGVDSSNNVWFATEGTASATQGIGEVAFGTATATYPSNSAYNSTANAGSYTFFVDTANGNKMYAGTQSTSATLGGLIYEYLSPTAAPTVPASVGAGATNGVSVDNTGAVWLVYTGSGLNGGSLSKFVPGASAAAFTCKVTATTGSGLYNPRGLAIDGKNRMFVTSYTMNTSGAVAGIIEFDPAVGTACDAGGDPGTFFTTPTGNGINPTTISAGTQTQIIAGSAARNETIDFAGALWTINGTSTAGFQPVVEILGIATPVNPVFAAGKYGVAP